MGGGEDGRIRLPTRIQVKGGGASAVTAWSPRSSTSRSELN